MQEIPRPHLGARDATDDAVVVIDDVDPLGAARVHECSSHAVPALATAITHDTRAACVLA